MDTLGALSVSSIRLHVAQRVFCTAPASRPFTPEDVPEPYRHCWVEVNAAFGNRADAMDGCCFVEAVTRCGIPTKRTLLVDNRDVLLCLRHKARLVQRRNRGHADFDINEGLSEECSWPQLDGTSHPVLLLAFFTIAARVSYGIRAVLIQHAPTQAASSTIWI